MMIKDAKITHVDLPEDLFATIKELEQLTGMSREAILKVAVKMSLRSLERDQPLDLATLMPKTLSAPFPTRL